MNLQDSDAHILWRINWVRMGRFFRDELILDAIGSSGGNELLDKPTLRAAQLLLKVSEDWRKRDVKNVKTNFKFPVGEMRSPLEAGQSTPISVSLRENNV
jgi:hypothetical protein